MLTDFVPKEEFVAREIDYPDIAEKIRKKIISERSKKIACNSVWASECGHDCLRYLVYQQCDWEKAKPAEDKLLFVFNEGNSQEDQLLLDLQKAGIKIKDLQIHISISEANITGKLDCVVLEEDDKGTPAYLPCEIKSMSPNVYDSVNTVADFEKYPWTRKYYAQIQCYLKNDSGFYPYGYFLAKNKSSGEIKIIKDFDGSNTIKFNEKYWNELVKRAKIVNKSVFVNKQIKMQIAELENRLKEISDEKEKDEIQNEIADLTAQYNYPERIKYDIKVCKGCKYEHICISDLSLAIGNLIENESIKEAIEDYVTTKANKENYSEAEKEYKKSLATLKELFPLENSIYMSDKYIVETKIRKLKGTEYLAFDITPIAEDERSKKK